MTPYLWVFNRGNNKGKPKAPRNVAAGNGFYDFKIDQGEVSTELEEAFMILEDKAAKILKKIVIKQGITIEEKAIFSEFLYFMHTRVPRFRESVNKFTEQISIKMMKVAVQQPDYLKSVLNEVDRKNGEANSNHDIDQLVGFINSDLYTVEVPQEMSLKSMLESSQEVIQVIFEMSWEFLEAPHNVFFITSDNPVVVKDPYNRSKMFGDGFRSSPTVEVTFPLGPRFCLLGLGNQQSLGTE